MKYFTIKQYETIKLFLDRVKYDVGYFDFHAKYISREYGKGEKVIELHDNRNAYNLIKLDGPSDIMEEIYEKLKLKVDKVIKHAGEKPINNPALFKKSFDHVELDDISSLND